MQTPQTNGLADTVPRPASVSATDGQSVIGIDLLLVSYEEPFDEPARWWADATGQALELSVMMDAHNSAIDCSGSSFRDDVLADLEAWDATHEPIVGTPASELEVIFAVDQTVPPSGYEMVVRPDKVLITAADTDGGIAAAQTLRQLVGPNAFRQAPVAQPVLSLPCGTIRDAPACAWRGVLLDVARHFLPPREVRRFIDLAAMHHLNVVQLHLSDDQGWRFESVRHPELTKVGSWRAATANADTDTPGANVTAHQDIVPHGGFYTQDDLREIVAFAKRRGVTVVPEIDMPGHVEAAIAAYPWLGTTKQPRQVRTTWGISEDVLDPGADQVAFFADILDEVCDVFDSPFIHIGGDEVPTKLWQSNPDIVKRAGELGLTHPDGSPDVARLHGWFLAQMAAHLRRRERRAIVWDEAVGVDLPRDVVVMAWRGLRPAVSALIAGFDVVLAPEQYLYLDHRASANPDEPSPIGYLRSVEDVYAFGLDLLDKVPGGAGFQVVAGGLDACLDHVAKPKARHLPGAILGMQAALWSEYLENPRRLDYAAFPRLAAFAEVAWGSAPDQRAPGSKASLEFVSRLQQAHLPRLAAAGVEYRPLEGPLPWQTKPGGPSRGTADLDQDMAAAGGVL